MHYTNGGKHVDTSIDGCHTLFVADVTCGNCKRTRNYRAAVDSQAAIQATTGAIESVSSAGFVINHSYRNHSTGQSYYITAVDRFGIRVTAQGEPHARTFPTLSEFLAWITPQDMDVNRIIEHVTDASMTWVDAMDLEWSLAAEVKSVEAIEYVVNDALMSRIRDMAKTEGLPVAEDAEQMPRPFRTSRKVKSTRQARRARRGA